VTALLVFITAVLAGAVLRVQALQVGLARDRAEWWAARRADVEREPGVRS
jgi:hypothetical protein